MNVARLLYPVFTLGPGRRVGIWLRGCDRGCKECSNPELWTVREECEIPVRDLIQVIRKLNAGHAIDGFTITGGEPLRQAEELSLLLSGLQEFSRDILIYTGYTMEEILEQGSPAMAECVRKAAVVVDGPYAAEKNEGTRMVGSSNQRVILIRPEYEAAYRDYLSKGPLEVQNFVGLHGAYSIGVHRSDFAAGMIAHLNRREDSDHE